jgi:heat shock protein HslJ
MPRLLFAAALAALVAGVAAAGGEARDGGQPSLTGQTWQLTKLGPLDGKAAGITALFTKDGRLSGFAGCNDYSGTYEASGAKLTISKKLAVTQKACPRLVMAREHAYLTVLAHVGRYSISGGTLTLEGKAGRAALATFRVQSPSLAGSWLVTGYNNGKGAVASVMASTKLTAVFTSAQDTVSGFAGCNDYSGAVKVTTPKIAIGPLSSTKKECSSPAGDPP